MIKIEDILFWILIFIIVGVIVWLAFGSPSFETSLLAVVIFVASSEILLWKFLFAFNKRTAVGFERVRSDLKLIENKFENMGNKLTNIENDVRDIKHDLKYKNKYGIQK